MKVLIMGRTNVGKSSLFNRLIKRRKSLVIDEEGITRDLLRDTTVWWGESFEVIDSGGLPDKKDELSLKILEKINEAIKMTDLIVVMVDAKASLLAEDFEVLKKARKSNKPFLLFINKVDHPAHTNNLTTPFYQLHPDFLSGSVENNYAVDEIIEWIISHKKKNSLESTNPDESKQLHLRQSPSSVKLDKNSSKVKPFFSKQADAKSDQVSPSKQADAKSDQVSPSKLADAKSDQVSPSKQADAKSDQVSPSKLADAKSDQVSPSKLADAKSDQVSPSKQADAKSDQVSPSKLADAKSDSVSFDLSSTEEDHLPKLAHQKTENPVKLFVIGRANGGKSLLCNQILGTSRMIVSTLAGTTLDTVTEVFSHKSNHYSISDNPGSRRGNRAKREKISFTKSRSELGQSDIVLLVLDAQLKPGRQESRLIELCLTKQKPVLLVLNKADLINKEEKKEREEDIKKTFHFYSDLPYLFLSAKTGYHKKKLFEKIETLSKKLAFQVSTSELNRFFFQVIRKAPAPVYGNSDVKFYYVNQTKKRPPEFLAFTNYPKGVSPAYKRFVIKKIKEKWNLDGIPISFHALKK